MKVPQKFFETREEFQEFIETQKEWMYNRIVESIEDSFNRGFITAQIVEARIEESMSIIAINSEDFEWITSLKLAMKWNEEQERYETCAKIQKLIEDIKILSIGSGEL